MSGPPARRRSRTSRSGRDELQLALERRDVVARQTPGRFVFMTGSTTIAPFEISRSQSFSGPSAVLKPSCNRIASTSSSISCDSSWRVGQPYGYGLQHEPHPDPRRARAGIRSRGWYPAPDQAPWRWRSSSAYTGRLYWNRLDFRAVKQGDGPLVRREREHWIQAERRHDAPIPDDCFERVQAEMHRRQTGQTSPRRRTPKRFYVLGGIRSLCHRSQPPAHAGQDPQGQHLLRLRLPHQLRRQGRSRTRSR
jgi:hypothetical protein